MIKRSVLIMLIAIALPSMAACNGGKDIETETDSYVYNEIKVEVDDKYNEMYPNGFDTQIYGSCINNNNLYYAVRITPKYDDEYDDDVIKLTPEELEKKYGKVTDEGKVYRYDLAGGTCTEMCSIDNVSELDSLIVSNEEQIILLDIHAEDMSTSSEDSFSGTITRLNKDGSIAFSTDISDSIQQANNTGGSFIDEGKLNKARYAKDGTLYVAADLGGEYKSCLLGFDDSGNRTCIVYTDNYIEDIIFDNNGKVIIGTNTGYDLKYSYVDTDSSEPSYETISGDEYNFGYDGHGGPAKSFMYDGYNDTSFYVRDVDNLYTYDNGSHEMKYMLNWLDTGIIGKYVQNLTYTDDGRLFCTCEDNMMNYTFGYIEKVPDLKKQTITYAALYEEGDVTSERQENVIRYNRTSDKYKVKLIDYSNEIDPEEALAKDIMTGNIPDVIDINTVDAAKYVNSGLFCDLMPYLEKDDTVNKDYFTDGLIDVMAYDGRLYYITKNFRIETVAVKKSDAEQYGAGWTMSEFIDYYNSKPEGTKLSSTDSKSELFDRLIGYNIESYIDRTKGEVKFDSSEFKAAAEFCSRFPDNYEIYDDYNDVRKEIGEGKILVDFVNISEISDIRLSQTLFGGDVLYPGYPSEDKRGIYICPCGNSPAITASSKNKDAAWDFIKSIITYDSKEDEYKYRYMPAVKSEFENMLLRVSASEKYTLEDGTVIGPYGGTSVINNLEIDQKPFSKEDVQLIRDFVKNGKLKTDNSKVMEIVSKEMRSYFNGTKSLDEVINILQDRVYKYVNENA